MAGRSITPERYRDILRHKRENPDITLEDLAAWAKNAFDLARTPRTSTINHILHHAHETLEVRIDPSVLSPLLNKVLAYWIVHRQSRTVPPTKREIQEKAQIFAADIGLEQDKPGFAATWWAHFEELHGLSCERYAKGDFTVSIADQSLLASSEWTDEQLLDLAFDDLERTVEDLEPRSELDVSGSPSSSPQPTPTLSWLEALSRAQQHYIRRQRTRCPSASYSTITENVTRKFGVAYALSEASVARILEEIPDPIIPASPQLGVFHTLAWLTEVQRARIYQYAQCNPEFSNTTIASWAYYELGLQRQLTAAEVEGVVDTFQCDSRPDRPKPLRTTVVPLTPFQCRQIRKKKEKNPSCSAMTLMCWAKSEFRLPGAPSAADILDILSICDGKSEFKTRAVGPISKIPRKSDRSLRGHKHRAVNRRSTPYSTWSKDSYSLPRPQRPSDIQTTGRVARDLPVSFQDTTLCVPAMDTLTRSWLFSIPSLGVIGHLTSEAMHYQQSSGSAVGSSDEDAVRSGENSGGYRRAWIKTHSASGDHRPVSDDGGDQADDENDDAYGYAEGIYTTVETEGVEKQRDGMRTRNAHQRWSACEQAADSEDTDRSESRYDLGLTIDRKTMVYCKNDQRGVERHEEDTYMDMDVDEASCILSAMGISKEVENTVVVGEVRSSSAQSWTTEQQSMSLQVALTTLDPNDLTQRSAYVVLMDMSRRITTLGQDECFQEHLRAFSQRWSHEEQLQSLFTVATLLDMQNPFHFAAYVVLTNKYNKIKDDE
ncbi:hypothetical protein EC968_002129 [Mortierella alpina]|nr:hypothetical protein EC968_002129 [Mortierella alpina]